MDYNIIKEKMNKSIDNLREKFAEVRAGRANPAILNKVKIDYYGTPTPINQVAGVSVPEARMIVIQPWDISVLKEIEKAIYLAKHKDVQLLIFPECSLTGYPPRDISNSSCVNFNLVQSMCDRLQSVADQNDISFIVGTIFKEKEIYNRALLFQPNKQIKSYDKRALWGWDNDNFAKGNSDGIVEIDGVVFGIRICFEIRFPEFFRELYKRNTDINVVLFYDVADTDDKERYSMIRGHLQTRAVENVTTTISVNATSPFQTAPTMVFGKSGQCIKECVRNKPELLIYDFEKTVNDFGENGRTSISNSLINW